MFDILLQGGSLLAMNDLFSALPLVIVVSLVYSATRHEDQQEILQGALRMGVWVVGFMLVIFAVLWLIEWQL